jgi:hypothetical protein
MGRLRRSEWCGGAGVALAWSGGLVECRSLISDAGRSMGEVMAGVSGLSCGAPRLRR